jgi:hypothetical protein
MGTNSFDEPTIPREAHKLLTSACALYPSAQTAPIRKESMSLDTGRSAGTSKSVGLRNSTAPQQQSIPLDLVLNFDAQHALCS